MASQMLIDYTVNTSLSFIYTLLSILIIIKVSKTLKDQDINNIAIGTKVKTSYLSVLMFSTLWLFSIVINHLIFAVLNSLSFKYNAYTFCKIHLPYQLFLLCGYETSVLNYFATRISGLLSRNPKMSRFMLPKWIIPCYQITIWLVAIITIIIGWISAFPIIINVVTETVDPSTFNPSHSPSNWSFCLSVDQNVEGHNQSIRFSMVLTLFCIFIYVMNLIIWFLFINRFYVIIKYSSIGFTKNDKDNMLIVHVMKKQTLLVGIATTSTIILWVVALNVPNTMYLWISDFFVTELCVFLSLGSFEEYYEMLGFYFCERKCCKCIDNVIESKLNKEMMEKSTDAHGTEIAV